MEIDLVNLVMVLAAAWGGGRLAIRLGLPAVLGEIGAGVLLGPPVLGLVSQGPALAVLAQLGVLLMMLYIGMETDPRDLRRASWPGLMVAVGGFALPFVGATLAARAFGVSPVAAAFVGVAAGVTSLATKARVLVDLGIMRTRISHVMMSGAIWTDVASLVAFTAILGLGAADQSSTSLLEILARASLFFAGAALIGGIILPRLARLILSKGRPPRTASLTLVLAFAIGMARLAEAAGLHGIIGAFVAGLFMRRGLLGRQLAADLRQVVHDAALGFLAPIFFVTIAFEMRLGDLGAHAPMVVVLVLVATVGKIVGTALAYLPTRRGWREALVIGAGMNDRGAVEIIMAGVALRAGLIDEGLFAVLILLAVLTTATVPLLLKAGVAWLERRGELVRTEDGRCSVVIIGAGQEARTLAGWLRQDRPVCMVDQSPDLCAEARSAGLEVVEGDALDEAVLEAAGATDAAVAVLMTPSPSLNALAARILQVDFAVPEVLVQAEGEVLDPAVLRHLGARTYDQGATVLPAARLRGGR